MKATPNAQARTIGFSHPGSYGYQSARSGPIECTKGFKVQFKLLKPRPSYSDWGNTYVYMIDSRIPLTQDESKLDSVMRK